MDFVKWALLITVFFITSVISVVTGSTSLVTVPVMNQLGIEPRTAIATNMLVLMFVSAGGAIPFAGKNIIDRSRLSLLIGLTISGSVIGALLVTVIPVKAVPIIISISMIAVAVFFAVNPHSPERDHDLAASKNSELLGCALTFALGIYGGFFSGGYITLLTAVYVSLFRMPFLRAVATTKVINFFSSFVAVLIFAWKGLIDFRLGLVLSVVAFTGSLIGASSALRVNNRWLQRIFLMTVIVIALKTIFFDVLKIYPFH